MKGGFLGCGSRSGYRNRSHGALLGFGARKEYVTARLDTVLYVDAQSVQIGLENEGIRRRADGRMEYFRELVTEKDGLERAIIQAGLENRIRQRNGSGHGIFGSGFGCQGAGNGILQDAASGTYYDISMRNSGRLLEGY